MSELFATYGPDALVWALTALGTLLSSYVFVLVRAGYVRETLQRAWVEVQGAVLEVSQTYADEIKRASADGTLTDDEKREARTMAVEIAKSNLGKRGLSRLGRVLGLDVDKWLVSKTEQAVKLTKAAAGAAGIALPEFSTIPPPVATPAPPLPPIPR